MRQIILPLLLGSILLSPASQAIESTPATPTDTGVSEPLQRQPENTQASSQDERENAQLAYLRQENQRLKLRLKEAQAKPADRLLNERQLWFLIGGGVALLGTLFGALLRGKRRQRGEWLN